MTTRQRTLASEARFEGVGVHSGAHIRARLLPAPAGSGITFIRTDLRDRPAIAAKAKYVVDTRLSTTLGHDGVRISTVEHVIAALAGLGVDNCAIELDGEEVPILDGSSAPFVRLILDAGLVEQSLSRRVVVVRRPVTVAEGQKKAALIPSADGRLHLKYTIEYDHPLIGVQTWSGPIDAQTFVNELAPARTYGLLRDVQAMRAAGLARGGSLDNAVVLDDHRVLNPEGLRFEDEFVRHKALDALGDLALAGYPMAGTFVATRAGHELNQKLVAALLASRANYALVPAEEVLEVPVQAAQAL